MKFHAIFVFALITWVSAEFTTTDPFFGQQYTRIGGPRGLLVDEEGDLLVLSQGSSRITAVYENENGDGSIDVVQVLIVDGAELFLNHGIAYHNGSLYASNSATVYRWPYTPGQRSLVTAEPQVVIQGMPAGGQHNTRTLVFDAMGNLYVNIGSALNVDSNSDRSRVCRFILNSLPVQYSSGEVFADGLRNEVGLAFDSAGVLWGVENGADELNRPDLGGDIHNGNPAEEMNRFDKAPGTFYGYPYCFSTHNLDDYEKGTQFAWPSSMNDGIHNDAWCKNTSNNNPPTLAMPAHNAPLGIEFYKGQNCDGGKGAFPCSAVGDAVVSFHGSWNSDIQTGYRVAWLPFNKTTSLPTGENVNLIYDVDAPNCDPCFRPVNAVFNKQGHLIISGDSTAEIFKVTFEVPPPRIRSQKRL